MSRFSENFAHFSENICTFCCDLRAFCVKKSSVTDLACGEKITNVRYGCHMSSFLFHILLVTSNPFTVPFNIFRKEGTIISHTRIYWISFALIDFLNSYHCSRNKNQLLELFAANGVYCFIKIFQAHTSHYRVTHLISWRNDLQQNVLKISRAFCPCQEFESSW